MPKLGDISRAAGLMALAALTLVGCDQQSDTGEGMPQAARHGGSRAQRIVSVAPSATEIIYALGLGDRLIGRTRYCEWPTEVRQVPSIGALHDLSLERLATMKPDVIFVTGRTKSTQQRLAPLDARLVSLPDETLADIFASVRMVGSTCDREQAASKLVARLEADLQRTAAHYVGGERLRVLLLTGILDTPPSNPFVAGPGSFYADLLERAGHENAAGSAVQAFAPLSLEFIRDTDPDVIVELDATGARGADRAAADAAAREAWARVGDLAAVRNHRVHVLSGNRHYIPGPRIATAFADLCAVLEPGLADTAPEIRAPDVKVSDVKVPQPAENAGEPE